MIFTMNNFNILFNSMQNSSIPYATTAKTKSAKIDPSKYYYIQKVRNQKKASPDAELEMLSFKYRFTVP